MASYRVVVGNNKGGSGKTCAVVNFAAALAEQGHRVLVVDMDPQANASRRLGWGWDPSSPTPTVSEAIKDGGAGVAVQALTACGWGGDYTERIKLLPSRWDLENRVSEAGVVGAVSRLRAVLEGVDDDIDVTLIDCPPSLGHLPQMAMAAAHGVLCAVEPEYDSVEGAVKYRDFVAQHRTTGLSNPDLAMAGYLVSRVRKQIGAHTFQLDGFDELFGDLVWDPWVPERSAHKDAADAAIPLRALGTSAGREMASLWTKLAGTLASQRADALKEVR